MTTNNSLNAPIAFSAAKGGTGTSTTFTSGSIVFSGTSGVYNQNNSNLFWDNTNNRLGLGTSSPTEALHVTNTGGLSSAVAIVQSTTSTGMAVVYLDRLDTSSSSQLVFSTAGISDWTLTSTSSSPSLSFSSTSTSNAVVFDQSGDVTLVSKMSSASANISGLTASKIVFTDGSKNLTSTQPATPQSVGLTNQTSYSANALIYQNSGNTGFTSGSDFTFNGSKVLSISTSVANPQISVGSTLTGSANSASFVLSRGDLANGSNIVYFSTAGSIEWQIREAVNSSNMTFTSFSANKEVLTLGLSDYSVTVPNGNLIFNTATTGLQLTHAAVSAGTANATLVTNIVPSSGTVTVNNSAVTSSYIGIPFIITRGGTLAQASISCGSGTFTLTTGSLDTSTYGALFIKSL